METLLEALCRALHPLGFDLLQPFNIDAYNRSVAPQHALPAPRPDALAVLVGNTKHLWPRFIRALAREPARLRVSDPLDAYSEDALGRVLPRPEHIFYAHTVAPPLPFQRMCDLSGMASLMGGRLLVHPEYGPWISLRGVLCFDREGPPPRRASSVCADCPSACEPAFERAMAKTETMDQRGVSEVWRDWLAVRDACPLGRDHRFSEPQIQYHYLKDPEVLKAQVQALGPSA